MTIFKPGTRVKVVSDATTRNGEIGVVTDKPATLGFDVVVDFTEANFRGLTWAYLYWNELEEIEDEGKDYLIKKIDPLPEDFDNEE